MEGYSTQKDSGGRKKKKGQYREHHQELRDSQRGHSQEIVPQQQNPTATEEEELGPELQASLDYHNFLQGPSKVKKSKVACSFPAPPTTPKDKFNGDIILNDFSAPSTAFKVKAGKGKDILQSPLLNKTSQCLSGKDYSEAIPTHALQKYRNQAQDEQASWSEAPKKTPQSKSDLSILTDIPATLTSSVIPSSSSLPAAPLTSGSLRSSRTAQSIPAGPLSSISYKEIDPVKLQPFIGPLTKQQPPPDRPLPQIPFPSPIKRCAFRNKSATSMADDNKHGNQEMAEKGAKKSMEETAGPHVGDKKGKGLRKKISKFFSGEQPSRSADTTDTTVAKSFRPLSINTSRDSKTFSDIFDDVYNAAGGPHTSGRASRNSRRNLSRISGRVSRQSGDDTVPAASDETLPRLSSQLHATGPPSRKAPTPPSATPPIEPPPLIEHPAIRGNLALQAQLGLIDTKSVPLPDQITRQDALVLTVSRQRTTPTDLGTRKTSHSVSSTLEAITRRSSAKQEPQTTANAEDIVLEDVDPLPAFDRTVDLTVYRKSRREGRCLVASVPRPSGKFTHVWKIFTEQYAKGRPFNRYNKKKRFRYFDLPGEARFLVVRHIIADTHTGKPILLNGKRQAYPAWPDDAFDTLWSVLEPLQAYLWASPHMRADIMITLLLTRQFHVIFSPFMKPASSPLATKWLTRYLPMMQNVRLELDMTKLGFGHSWEATAMSAKLQDIGDLVWMFTETILTRDAVANSVGQFTIHCRRYFGYRQGKNPLEGREGAYKYPLRGSDDNDPRALNISKDGSEYNPNKPWNYNRTAPSLPPSAKNPYSGHRRHHADRPNRVPYVNEAQFSVADSLRKLVGRVDNIRMVGFSEDWTFWTHEALWPKEEQDAIPDEEKHSHIDRCTPSRHDYVAPGHAVYFDFGIGRGIHRYPPLPDSEPMVCVHYDIENDLYAELGSGKVLTVTEDGAEFIPRVRGPKLPVLARIPSPEPCGPPLPRGSRVIIVRPSRIPVPKDHRNVSLTMEAMRKGTPAKAAQLLGLPGTNITNTQLDSDTTSEAEDDDGLATPTKSFSISKASAMIGRMSGQSEVDRMSELALQHSRSSSTTGTGIPPTGKLSSKRSLLLLGGSYKKST